MNNVDTLILSQLENAFGPINEYLNDPLIIEIMLNPDGKLWIDHIKEGRRFTGHEILPEESSMILKFVATSTNTVCTEDNPILSAELPGSGNRFQGLLPPIVQKPTFTIRKKAQQIFSLQQYVDTGVMTLHQKETIVKAVHSKENILVVGSTGSGKTTLCNAILAEIATTNSRIVIIEDTQELQCSAPDTVCVRTKDDVCNIQDALKATMRLRPDRIIVGEVRGGEAYTLLKAWNTGHPGGLSTVHANSAYSALERIQDLAQEAITGAVSKTMIAEAINYCVFIDRTPTGRKVKEIIKIHGHDGNKYLFTSKNE